MSVQKDFQLKAKNFRCFGEDAQGFDSVYPINVIIGKNNSGKSALLKLVNFASRFSPPLSALSHNKTNPTVFITNKISQSEIERVFTPSHKSGRLPGFNDRDYGFGLIGQKLTVQLQDGNQS